MDTRYIERMEEAFKHKRYFISIIRELAEQRTPKQALHRALHGFSLDDKPASILDYGCGSGLLTYKLAEAFPYATVIGYDQSLEIVEIARERFSAPNLRFTTRKDEVEGKGYDYIVLSSVLHEIWSHNGHTIKPVVLAFQEFRALLAPNGYLITRDNYLSANFAENIQLLFQDKSCLREAQEFLDKLKEFLPEALINNYNDLVFNENNLTLSGPEYQVKEFINKLTWGEESLPRESQELLFCITERGLRHLETHDFKLVGQELYRDNDYLEYLSVYFCDFIGSIWNTHIWNIYRKIDESNT